MGHVVEIVDVMSNCPLITSPLSWNVYIDGEPLFEQYKLNQEKKTTNPKEESFERSYARITLSEIGLETAENIKKLVTKKMDARTDSAKRDIRKY